MQKRTYTRATPIDLDALADAIRAHVIAATGSDAFYPSWDGQNVILEAANLSNVNNATVQAAVNAAPAPTNAASAKRLIDEMSPDRKASELVHLDELNSVRGALNPAKPPITQAEHFAALKAKVDSFVPDKPGKG